MSKHELPTDRLDVTFKLHFERWSTKLSFLAVAAFVVVLVLIWSILGRPNSSISAVYPRELASIPAIFLSNFFHANTEHLVDNLIWFIPLGFFVFKLEGVRGLAGVFTGMMIAGVAQWLFGEKGFPHYGFSGVVMACWGILFISIIRRSYRWTIVFLFLSFWLLEHTLFETIRPTDTTEANNISWLGHLGGLIGGIAAQVRSLPVALEVLYKKHKITNAEFVAIASRINKDVDESVPWERFYKVVGGFNKRRKMNVASENQSEHKKTEKKD